MLATAVVPKQPIKQKELNQIRLLHRVIMRQWDAMSALLSDVESRIEAGARVEHGEESMEGIRSLVQPPSIGQSIRTGLRKTG